MIGAIWDRRFIAGRQEQSPAATLDDQASVDKESEPSEPAAEIPKTDINPPVIGILGSKGGVGATTLAVNLAAACAQTPYISSPITLVDANLQQPDVALLLATEPANNVVDLLARIDEMNPQIFDACRYSVKGTVKSLGIISPPLTGEAGVKSNLSMLSDCLKEIVSYSGLWVLDLPRALDRHLVSMLDTCTVIVVVVEPNLASIAAAKRWLTHFDDLGYHKSRVIIAVNRSGGKLRHIEDRIGAAFQEHEIVKVPNVYALAEECSVSGEPIVLKKPRDPYAKAMSALVKRVSDCAQSKNSRAETRGN